MLSPSTEERDCAQKMPIYAGEGVRHAWLIDPIASVLELYVLRADERWDEPTIYRDAELVRAPPFDAIELDLSALWA